MKFTITHKDESTRARTGVIETSRGNIETPVFMPVGTQGTVKALSPEDLRPQIAKAIVDVGGLMVEMKIQSYALEDIYLKYFKEA